MTTTMMSTMSIKKNHNAIFEALMVQHKQKETENKEKENINEVAPATSKTTEDKHGGDEATGDIESSPNSKKDGMEDKKNSNNPSQEKGEEKGLGQKSNSEDKAGIGNSSKNKKEDRNGLGKSSKDKKEDKKGKGLNGSSSEIIKKLYKPFKPGFESEEEMVCRITRLVKKIAKQYTGLNKGAGYDRYDTSKIAKHLISRQHHLLPYDKYKKEDCKTVVLFLDTSGSLQSVFPAIIEAMKILVKQGFTIELVGVGNGFWHEDADDDDYGVRKYLMSIIDKVGKGAKLSEVVRPTEETAARLANNAEFSLIIADFDGLSSICKMANLCKRGKIPYFLSTEDRYSWASPTDHDWVDPNYSHYDMSRVYDISLGGNEIFSI